MSLLEGITLGTDAYVTIGRGIYAAETAGLNDPTHSIKINPGTTSKVSKNSLERRRSCSWIVTREFDVASPSQDQPARQRVQVAVTVLAGLDLDELQINEAVDISALVPDSDRLLRIMQGNS